MLPAKFHTCFIWIILAFSGSSLCIQSCQNHATSTPTDEELNRIPYLDRLPEISYTVLRRGNFAREIVSNGKIMARQKADLYFSLNETITEIHVANGSRIGKGEVIARLENTKLLTDLYDARQVYEEALIELKDLLISHRKTIEDTTEINRDLFTTMKIRSGFIRADNGLKKAKTTLRQSVMYAPFTGVIANLNAKPYNLPPTDGPFCTLVDLNALDVEFSVLETELQWIDKGRTIILLPYTNDTVSYRGKISEVNPLVDEHGMIAVRARITNPSGRLLDGMHVKIVVENIVTEQLVVPKEALVLRDGREVVFTYKKDSTVYWNYVKQGLENTDSFTILEGLKPGDSVVVSGNLNLAHMTKVNGSPR
ncbi:MAG: efflux RND transporter periplasmic adaptor subunit [Cyclobacteriaceae bacterium]|nr:efflux RND transporter periplasmic adaptor subunit [Cyclobacteriaceae bacterium]